LEFELQNFLGVLIDGVEIVFDVFLDLDLGLALRTKNPPIFGTFVIVLHQQLVVVLRAEVFAAFAAALVGLAGDDVRAKVAVTDVKGLSDLFFTDSHIRKSVEQA
jgi:hypothetical protein